MSPPSVASGRGYTWSVDSAGTIAAAPDWLLDRLDQAGNGRATPAEEWHELALQGVDDGTRNQTITKLAGLLFRRLPEPMLAAVLVACFNAVKVRPPLEPEELKRTLDSIADREMRRRGILR